MSNSFVQTILDAEIDAKSLSEFVFKPAESMVQRRLAPPINTLQYYIDMLENISIGGEFNSAKIASLTVTTGAAGTSASVATFGTPSNRIFELTIPRGDTGAKGEPGKDGADGSFTQKAYVTEAAMIADKVNIPANTSVTVTNDPTSTKNGMYAYDGVKFTKSEYDPVSLANTKRLLGENETMLVWLIDPYYEKGHKSLYVKPSTYTTAGGTKTQNCLYLRDKRYGKKEITITDFYASLAETAPKVVSPKGVPDCVELKEATAILYNPFTNTIRHADRELITPEEVFLVANNIEQVGRCIEEPVILSKLNALKMEQPLIAEHQLHGSIKSIAHRGFSLTAPENTLPAYILAKKKGFAYVETDIEFTSDNVPVLLHDATINRTSNGTGRIGDMTLAAAKTYDFGGWKNSVYAGAKIPTLEEFLQLCHRQSLHPYLEIKSGATATSERVQIIIDTVAKTGMRGRVSYICFQLNVLSMIKGIDPSARLGYVVSTMTQTTTNDIAALKTPENTVFIDAKYTSITGSQAQYAHSKDVPIESWTVATNSEVVRLANLGVSGITSDGLDVQSALNAVDNI